MGSESERPQKTPNGEPTEPRLRLVQTSFARLSSGFRIPARADDGELMAISSDLAKRLRESRLRVVPRGDGPPSEAGTGRPPAVTGPSSLGTVLSRLHRLAASSSEPSTCPENGDGRQYEEDVDLSSVLHDLKRAAASSAARSEDPMEHPSAHRLDRVSASPMTQRLLNAIARARAAEANGAGASSDIEGVDHAEEQLLLVRSQALLEEGVARFTKSPARPRLKLVLN